MSRSLSSSSLKLTNNEGQNTIDKFLRASKSTADIANDWLGSLGRSTLKRVIKSVEEGKFGSDEFNLPPRKSVLFKEYAFSVQESIALGLPIIPFVGPGFSQPQFSADARRKKSNAEINCSSKNDHLSNVGGTSLEVLLRIANEEWLRENAEEQASSKLDTSTEMSEHTSTSFAPTARGSLNTNLKTLDRGRQTPPTRMSVHPTVLEATKTIPNNSSSSLPDESNRCYVRKSGGTPKSGSRGTVVFGPTSHRWIPRRTKMTDPFVGTYVHHHHQQMHFPQHLVCRPTQLYAAVPVHHPVQTFFAAYQPPRIPVYANDRHRIKLNVRRKPVRQIAQMPDYVDMRQIKLPPTLPDDHERL